MSGEKPPEWLPDGWIMEIRKTRTGSMYRCYFDPSTGSKFYSGKEAQRHLKDGKQCSTKSSQKRSQNTNLDNVIAQFEHSPDGLPRGWIKETKFRKSTKQRSGMRKDPYYTEPVTGYVFRSLKDCVRYIDTGKISKHAFLPKNLQKSNTSSSDMESSPPNSDEEMAEVVEELPEGSKSPSPQDRSAQCQNASDSAFTTQSTVVQEMKTRTGSEEVVQSVTGEWSESVNPPSDEPLMQSHGTQQEPSVNEQLELLSITPKSTVKSSKRSRRKSEVEQLLETQTNIEDLNKFGRGNSRLPVTESKSVNMELEPSAEKSSLLEDTHSLSVNQESSKGAMKHGNSGAKAHKTITGPRRTSKRLAILNSVQKPDLQTSDIPQQIIHSSSKKAKEVAPQTEPVLVKPDAETAEQPADLDKILATPFRGPLVDIMACPCIEFAVRTLTNDLPEFDGSLDEYVQSQLMSPPSSHPRFFSFYCS
ncbi:methyl-CpG-binding domain-containing protein 13 [Dioscorea cayenensis subsp. rotundata]|uniref:Methyl-CpG-binding domain-containing protein 13 n=1 Tax=Dioscorea cayennensis subsp. rotundata TaxID=55577 RepID=A0AB40C2Y9_DIOCR|nr:methyl-CpG-binding domain-containing protein 13 [Dioscorea cayenensis subsp. rotundata]